MKIKPEFLHTKADGAEIFCNKCGMSCKGHLGGFNGLIEAEVIGGYDSTHLDDLDVYIFSLCESCLKTMFETFMFPARQGNIAHPDNYNDNFDRHKYLSEGVKLWCDLSEDEKVLWKDLITSKSILDDLQEVPREELIVWLYDVENKTEKVGNEEKTINAIRTELKRRKDG